MIIVAFVFEAHDDDLRIDLATVWMDRVSTIPFVWFNLNDVVVWSVYLRRHTSAVVSDFSSESQG